MSLTISTTDSTNATPQRVPAARVHEMALAHGNPYGNRAIAVTTPRIRVDQTGLAYEQRRGAQGVEFRFGQGTLGLTLLQEVYLSNQLSACERRYWEQHEQLHVRDNRTVLGEMDQAIRASQELKPIFIDRDWYPRSNFNLIQQQIQNAVGSIFRDRTGAAVRGRDTQAEYARVEEEIRRNCRARRESGRSSARAAR